MTELFINTSTKKLVIGIIIDGIIKYVHKSDNSNSLSSDIMPIIDEAFRESKITPKDINTIYVTTGPGSFTGIRIGLTVAKVMAWSLKIKVVPISSLEVMSSTNTSKKYIAPLIDARRDYVFAALYDNNLNSVIKDSYILLDEFKSKVEDKDILFISHDNFEFETNDSDYDILRVVEKHRNDVGVNPHQLNPNYLKLTEAEENLNRK